MDVIRMATVKASAVATGRANGYRIGREHGLRLGACQAALQQCPPVNPAVRLCRVLYVPQGFDAIDLGIVNGLRLVASESFTAPANEMVSRAMELRPDLVLVLNGLHNFPAEHPEHLQQLRALGVKTAVWFADDPYFTDQTVPLAAHYDYVFTHELSCVALYRETGCLQSHYLPLAADHSVFRPQHVDPSYQTDVCFIGSGFPNRLALFDRLAPFLNGKRVLLAGSLWDQLVNYKSFKDGIRLQWTPIEETAKYYNGAKIVINVHRPTFHSVYSRNSRNMPGKSVNPRTFEMAACGSLQITDVRDDLTSYFTPGLEIETFTSAAELERKIAYYLKHEERRRIIAVNGFRRSLREHTFASRLARLLDIVFGA
jgi:spore maturation protein CgeB